MEDNRAEVVRTEEKTDEHLQEIKTKLAEVGNSFNVHSIPKTVT